MQMIRSMTGYGKGYLSVGNREYQVEIKSVNHRYLDISIKLFYRVKCDFK